MTRYALLRYSTNNLGDEIQSIAIQQFLPRIDLLVDRDHWTCVPPVPNGTCKIVLNGWFTHNPEKWPPPAYLLPCLISMHITRERLNERGLVPAEVLLAGESLDYLKNHGPVGCRDLWTTSLLRANGVESYFSGCVTLTLGTGEQRERGDYICAVDVPDDLVQVLRSKTRMPILRLKHRDPDPGSFQHRCNKAAKLLSLYAHAKAVVTTRLHCAMPCVAFGTPVLLIDTVTDLYRFTGLIELVRHCTSDSFASGDVHFNFEAPAPNSGTHAALRDDLIRRIQSFIGAPVSPFRPAAPTDLATLLSPQTSAGI